MEPKIRNVLIVTGLVAVVLLLLRIAFVAGASSMQRPSGKPRKIVQRIASPVPVNKILPVQNQRPEMPLEMKQSIQTLKVCCDAIQTGLRQSDSVIGEYRFVTNEPQLDSWINRLAASLSYVSVGGESMQKVSFVQGMENIQRSVVPLMLKSNEVPERVIGECRNLRYGQAMSPSVGQSMNELNGMVDNMRLQVQTLESQYQ